MGLQSISEILKALGSTAQIRSTRGVVCIILDDPTVKGVHTYTGLKSVSDSYSTANMAIITRCFNKYGVNKLIVATFNSAATPTAETISTALTNLTNVKFNYLACPTIATSADNATVFTFIQTQRTANSMFVKAVLNGQVADFEGVINFINVSATLDSVTYSGYEFCVDVACKLAITALDSSITNDTISGLTVVDNVGADLDALVDAGNLFLFYDYDLDEIVFSRGVNSKTTLATGEKAELKKIRIIDTFDMVRDDLRTAWKTGYQGKIDNSLANKRLLVSAYNLYLRTLVQQGVLSDSNTSYVELDVAATRAYAQSLNIDTSTMTDTQVLNIDTGTNVFITGKLYPLDCMEDLALVLNYN